MPDRTFQTTAAGWPYMDTENYVDATPAWSLALVTKLQNGEAAVPRAENAATRAENAAASMGGDGGWKSLVVAGGCAGTAWYRIIGKVVYLRGKITKTSFAAGSRVIIANMPVEARPTNTQNVACMSDIADAHSVECGYSYFKTYPKVVSTNVVLDGTTYIID